MPIFEQLVTLCWLVFVGYWIFSARGVKRTIGGVRRGLHLLMRLAVIVVVIFVAKTHPERRMYDHFNFAGSSAVGIVVSALGLVICICGIGLAIWARRNLGRNWGMPMSLKENPELVTTGPYTFVRHPIYGGALIAQIGSVLVAPAIWLVPFIVCFVYFTYSAKTEERNMVRLFPNDYPAYKKRTKMLIPFVI